MERIGRILIKEAAKKTGEQVLLKGWIHELRDLAKIKFLQLRDVSGIIQCVVKSEALFNEFKKLTLESSVEIRGKVAKAEIKSEIALKGVEIEVQSLKLLNKAENLPILITGKTITEDLSKRLDNRSIDLYNPKVSAIFKIQSEITNSFRKFFYEKGFYEIQPPSVIGSASEGGTNLFEIKYFEKKAYLAQSPQLYKQMLISSLEKVFMITPVWRAEKHNTIRHLNESRQMDIEVAFASQMEVIQYLFDAVKFIVKEVKEKCRQELELLGVNLEVPKDKTLTYDEVLELLNKTKKMGLKSGDDLSPEAEKELGKLFPNTIIAIPDWPSEIKPFYIMPKGEDADAKLSEGMDVHYGGMEISSGGQRIHLPELLIERLKAKGLNPKNFEYYTNSFRYGCPIHSGWSIGLERLTMLMLGLQNIREAVLFPRDRDRLVP